ncbi:MAG: acetyl-CoA carboxylase biotin carboxyl carrier protein subunit [Mesorhizobium sp.]
MELKSDVTGTVIEIVAAVGSSVSRGDVVVRIESMKMEIPLTASVSGRVTEMRVNEGDSVKEDAVVAVISAEAD